MTEAEWLQCHVPDLMLDAIEAKATDRKLRWFISACCRRLWPHLVAPVSRQVVECLERVADGVADEDELTTAAQEARAYAESPEAGMSESGCSAAYLAAKAAEDYPSERLGYVATRTMHAASDTWYWIGRETCGPSGDRVVTKDEAAGIAARRIEDRSQAELLREILGNPFRPLAFNPAWRTTDVTLLARGIYEEKAFDRMPILADALQDAECDNDDLLNHCRDPHAQHVRGCWALDAVLGKE